MLNAVIRFALRYRVLIVFLSLAALLYGGYVTANLPIDVFPDLDRPRVVVMTEALGMAPEEVETLITFPLESALLGATGVQTVRSQSGVGLSVVYVEFDWGTNIYLARQTVQERLTSVLGTLPPEVQPQMAPISSIMGQIMLVGMYRRPGPNGGELAPVGKTGYLAELVHDPQAGRVSLYLWDFRDAKKARLPDPADWKPVAASPTPMPFTWTADASPTVVLRPVPGRQGAFAAEGPLLKAGPAGPSADRERRASVAAAGGVHEVVFPPALQRQMDLRTTADWVIRPRLLKVPGLAQVTVLGGGRKQYQVLVDPTALLTYDVTLQQVEEALKKNNLNTSGGFAIQGEKERPIRILGRLGPEPDRVVRDLEQVVVKQAPQRNVLLAQVAKVVEAPQLKRGDASVNGHASVILMVTKQPRRDTRALTDQVTAALAELQDALPGDIVINPAVFQMKGFIDRAVHNVEEALLHGAVLVLIILFLFLLNFRTTFISLTAIPLSLVITGLTFKWVGWLTGTELSINVMTLGGIAVAMGELVDDAIVDVENIFRRLTENNALAHPRPALRVIYQASVEVRSAIVFGTMMVILVFIPLFALPGMAGRLFAPLGVAYIVSILASLVVSLTVTPVLSYYLLPQAKATHRHADSPLLRALKWGASHLIRFSMRHAGLLLLVSWLGVGVCIWVMTQLGGGFLPDFDEGSVQVNITLPPGSSLEASNKVTATADAVFRSMQKSAANPRGEILQFGRRTGRAELDEHAEPVSNTEYILTTNPDLGRSRNELLDQIQQRLRDEIPGVAIEREQPLKHLINHMLSGVTSDISIKVVGDDLDVLRNTAEQIKAAIATVPGITEPTIEAQQQIEELHIRLRPDRLAVHGVDRGFVADFLATALKGEEVSQVLEGQRRFDLVVRLEERFRTDYANLARLRLELPRGRGQVALGELAYVGEGTGANLINRENARRRLAVKCNVKDRALTEVVADLKQRIRQGVVLPAGYTLEYGGQFESQREATQLIAILAVAAFLGMFMVLYMLYPSLRVSLQILNALPTAFIGGVLALMVTGQDRTVAALVGFISLGGIAARNGILLVTHYFHLMKYEGEAFSEHMVLRGSLERLSPVLMTALTAGIGLVPLVLGGQQPGREILYPVATVILGGLITSTLCEFLIHPGIFWRFSGKDAERLTHEMDREDDLGGSHGPGPHAVDGPGGGRAPGHVAVPPEQAVSVFTRGERAPETGPSP
ncbi:MAG: efflux RND transporter permease subunit [Gemmataceae bacterium]|nr:efflux RND transporter permease subunit [Gemmataceae bacterium]